MKKKKLLTILSLSFLMTGLTSCDMTSSTSSVLTSDSGSSTGSGDSTTSSATGVTDVLNNGFDVATGIPDKGGDITASKASALIERFMSVIGGQEVPEGSYEQTMEVFVPNMQKGGVMNGDVDKLLPLLEDEELVQAITYIVEMLNGQTSEPVTNESILAFVEENGATLVSALKTIVGVLDADKFASIFATIVPLMSGSRAMSEISYINGLTNMNMEKIQETAPSPAKEFFSKIIANSDFGEIVDFTKSEDYQKMMWFMGRMSYGLLDSVLENFTDAEIVTIVKTILTIVSDPEFNPTAEQILPLANAAGKILEDCFMSRSAFQSMMDMSGQIYRLQDEAAKKSAQSYDNVYTFMGDLEETYETMAENADSYFNTLKFVGTMLRNASEEDFNAIMTFVNKILESTSGSVSTAPADYTPDIVRMAKILSTNLTRYGADSELILDSLKNVVTSLPINGGGTSIGSDRISMNITVTESDLSFDETVVGNFASSIMDLAKKDPENLTDADKTEINELMASTNELMKGSTTSYTFRLSNYIEVGESLTSVEVEKMVDGTSAGTQTVPVNGVDTKTNRYGQGSLTVGSSTVYFPYKVSNYPVHTIYLNNFIGSITGDGDSTTIQISSDSFAEDSAFEIYLGQGDSTPLTVPVTDVIDLDTRPGAGGMAYIPLEDGTHATEYYALSYEIY